MKILATILFTLLIGTVSAVYAQTSVSDELTLREGVKPHAGIDSLYEKFSKAYRDLDAKAFSDIYTSNAAYLAPEQDIQIGEIAKGFDGFFNSVRQRDQKLSISFEIVQRKADDAMAYDVGIYTLKTYNKDNAVIGTGRGKFVVVALRSGGSWKFQVDGFSPMPPGTTPIEPTIGAFSWLAGCWERSIPDRKMLVTEQWMKPAGGMLIGTGRTVVDGKTTDWEYLRIVEQGSGLAYIAKPKANAVETIFPLKSLTSAEAIFENPEHDFPQRIIYRRGDSGTMTARIEGTRNGQPAGIDFPFRRSACN